MPKFLNPEFKTDVKRLSKENYSCRSIQKKLKDENVDYSISSICLILKNIGTRQAFNAG